MKKGWSRPRRISQAWTLRAVAPKPRMDRHVPPGSRFKRQNVINVTPTRTGIVCSTRFPMILKLGERDQRLSIAHPELSSAFPCPAVVKDASRVRQPLFRHARTAELLLWPEGGCA